MKIKKKFLWYGFDLHILLAIMGREKHIWWWWLMRVWKEIMRKKGVRGGKKWDKRKRAPKGGDCKGCCFVGSKIGKRQETQVSSVVWVTTLFLLCVCLLCWRDTNNFIRIRTQEYVYSTIILYEYTWHVLILFLSCLNDFVIFEVWIGALYDQCF